MPQYAYTCKHNESTGPRALCLVAGLREGAGSPIGCHRSLYARTKEKYLRLSPSKSSPSGSRSQKLLRHSPVPGCRNPKYRCCSGHGRCCYSRGRGYGQFGHATGHQLFDLLQEDRHMEALDWSVLFEEQGRSDPPFDSVSLPLPPNSL